MSEWADVTIDDIKAESKSAISIGPFGSRLKSDQYSDSGVPVIRGTNLTRGRQFSGDFVYIPETLAETMPGCNVYEGDLVFPHRGAIGEVGIIRDGHYFLSTSLMKLTVNKAFVDPRWLYYFFRSPQGRAELTLNASQVGTPGIARPLNSLRSVRLSVPSLNEQQRIADTLDALNDKVELNRQAARTLEDLAQRLFKSWFVDFDPVRAKMAGRQPAHMPPETAALFPDHLVDSPLGPIPEGWEVKPIEDIVTIKGGATPSTKQAEYWEGGTYHWATPKDLSGLEQKVLVDTNRKITSAGVEKISSGQLPDGTVLMSSRAPVGYLALADMPVSINQGFIAMICDRGVPNTYILHWADSSMDVIKSNAGGSTFAEISKKQFRPLDVVVPSAEILEAYDELTSDCFKRTSKLAHENVILGKLRDRLLPKLISGEIRVPDAREIAEEA